MTAVVEEKQDAAALLDQKAEKKQVHLDHLDEKIADVKQIDASVAAVDTLPRKTLGGNFQLTPADWQTVSGLAKEGIKSRGIIAELREKVSELLRKIMGLEMKLKQYEGMA